jgi:hypothetical protein
MLFCNALLQLTWVAQAVREVAIYGANVAYCAVFLADFRSNGTVFGSRRHARCEAKVQGGRSILAGTYRHAGPPPDKRYPLVVSGMASTS